MQPPKDYLIDGTVQATTDGEYVILFSNARGVISYEHLIKIDYPGKPEDCLARVKLSQTHYYYDLFLDENNEVFAKHVDIPIPLKYSIPSILLLCLVISFLAFVVVYSLLE